MSVPWLVLSGLAVAAANGAHDNFKGVATLFRGESGSEACADAPRGPGEPFARS